MSLLDKFVPLEDKRRLLVGKGRNPVGVPFSRILSSVEGEIDGQPVILAGTNNYLGLTFEPSIIAATQAALERSGTGTTGSRMANGTYDEHLSLEKELADFHGVCSAIVFTTGYQANLGVIATLAGPDDVILIDAHSHASIYDAVRMAGSRVYRFKHNDSEALAKRLQRLGDQVDRTLIVVESLYSMLGDQAPLQEFVEVKNRHGGYLLVDEAHALGVFGATGCGLVEELGLAEQVEFITGTFSKSLATIGGYCVSNIPQMDLIRNVMRTYTFTASPTPAAVATARAALAVLRARPQLRERLWENAHRLHAVLGDMGFSLGAAPGPVVSVLIDPPTKAIEAWRALLDAGVYVNLVIPPASPGSYALLRCSLSAAHTKEHLDKIIIAYEILERRGLC